MTIYTWADSGTGSQCDNKMPSFVENDKLMVRLNFTASSCLPRQAGTLVSELLPHLGWRRAD